MKKNEMPFWYRVGSAFENGYGNEGWLAILVARLLPIGLLLLFFGGVGALTIFIGRWLLEIVHRFS